MHEHIVMKQPYFIRLLENLSLHLLWFPRDPNLKYNTNKNHISFICKKHCNLWFFAYLINQQYAIYSEDIT